MILEKENDVKILLTAFRGTSAEALIKGNDYCPSLYLPNDRKKDSENLIRELSANSYIPEFGASEKEEIAHVLKEGVSLLQEQFNCFS